jgi:hypothetical protein
MFEHKSVAAVVAHWLQDISVSGEERAMKVFILMEKLKRAEHLLLFMHRPALLYHQFPVIQSMLKLFDFSSIFTNKIFLSSFLGLMRDKSSFILFTEWLYCFRC